MPFQHRQVGCHGDEWHSLIADDCTISGNPSGYTVLGAESVLVLTNCHSNGDVVGCCAQQAGKLSATYMRVLGCRSTGFRIQSGAHAKLWGCTAANCSHQGVSAEEGSRVEMERCILQQNRQHGATAYNGAVVQVQGCSSSGNLCTGYSARTHARMTVSSSSSVGDNGCCGVTCGGKLRMQGLSEDGVLQSGNLYWPASGTHLVISKSAVHTRPGC